MRFLPQRLSVKIIYLLLLLSSLVWLVVHVHPPEAAFAAEPELQIYIHKNTPEGSLWDDYLHQIRLKYFQNGSRLDDSDDTPIPISAKLYPYGAQGRVLENSNSNSGPVFIGLNPNGTPTTSNEGFVSIPLRSAGEYAVEIETDPAQASAIRSYRQDSLTPTGENLTTYSCQPAPSLTPVCRAIIVISDQDFQNASQRDTSFRLDLVIVVIPGSAESRAEVEPLKEGVNAELSEMVTMIGRFAIRVQNLLSWSLQISQDGLNCQPGQTKDCLTIELIYGKVLNIVNGLFIILLLVIAFMWNMSLVIPRRYVRKVMIVFIFAIILVNFSFPLNKLLINLANTVQSSLLVKDVRDATGQVTKQKISAGDILSIIDADYGAFVGLAKSDYLARQFPVQGTPSSFPSDPGSAFTTLPDTYVNRNQEPIYFNLGLILLGTIAQLLLSLLLLFRIIVLWFFLILSPFLFLLVLLNFLKQFFKYWSWLYFRWLFIGPLIAICLFIAVNIWSLLGVPIESAYAPPAALWFQNATNLYLSAPGVTSGYLNTPREVMKYLAALLMLYMSVILPFWLTRRFEVYEWQPDKILNYLKKKTPVTVKTKIDPPKETPPTPPSIRPTFTTPPNMVDPVVEATPQDAPTSNLGMTWETSFSAPVNSRAVADLAKAETMQSSIMANQTAAAELNLQDKTLQAQIQQMDTSTMLYKLHLTPVTNVQRNETITLLSQRDSVTNATERTNLEVIVNELERRTKKGDRKAATILEEIHATEKTWQEEVKNIRNVSTAELTRKTSVENMVRTDRITNLAERQHVEAVRSELSRRGEQGDSVARQVSEQVKQMQEMSQEDRLTKKVQKENLATATSTKSIAQDVMPAQVEQGSAPAQAALRGEEMQALPAGVTATEKKEEETEEDTTLTVEANRKREQQAAEMMSMDLDDTEEDTPLTGNARGQREQQTPEVMSSDQQESHEDNMSLGDPERLAEVDQPTSSVQGALTAGDTSVEKKEQDSEEDDAIIRDADRQEKQGTSKGMDLEDTEQDDFLAPDQPASLTSKDPAAMKQPEGKGDLQKKDPSAGKQQKISDRKTDPDLEV